MSTTYMSDGSTWRDNGTPEGECVRAPKVPQEGDSVRTGTGNLTVVTECLGRVESGDAGGAIQSGEWAVRIAGGRDDGRRVYFVSLNDATDGAVEWGAGGEDFQGKWFERHGDRKAGLS